MKKPLLILTSVILGSGIAYGLYISLKSQRKEVVMNNQLNDALVIKDTPNQTISSVDQNFIIPTNLFELREEILALPNKNKLKAETLISLDKLKVDINKFSEGVKNRLKILLGKLLLDLKKGNNINRSYEDQYISIVDQERKKNSLLPGVDNEGNLKPGIPDLLKDSPFYNPLFK